jgi:hypothetical protein
MLLRYQLSHCHVGQVPPNLHNRSCSGTSIGCRDFHVLLSLSKDSHLVMQFRLGSSRLRATNVQCLKD